MHAVQVDADAVAVASDVDAVEAGAEVSPVAVDAALVDGPVGKLDGSPDVEGVPDGTATDATADGWPSFDAPELNLDAAVHVDSKYPDQPQDGGADQGDAIVLDLLVPFDSSGPDCPMAVSGVGMVPYTFCSDAECCLSGFTAGPCGWTRCCAEPGTSYVVSLPTCDVPLPSVTPPWIPWGPCPALQQYTKPFLPPCKAECWCD